MTAVETSFYVVGGTLHRAARSYVRRHADDELFDGLNEGQFCYVLTSRQMGKSSLMVRTAVRLRQQGASVVVLDLTAVGQNLTAEQWYEGLLNLAGQQLHLEDVLENFWLAHDRIGPLQRWMRAMREVVLRHCSGRVVIFVDEIDAVRSLPFSTDEFFAGIREFYNARTEDPELHRLTFGLLGVAKPSDLIRDTRMTPFNIGRRIELHDFTEPEAAPLVQGFGADTRLSKKLLQRVIYWTGGHPYLTQRLCQAIADSDGVRDTDGVDHLCEELFFSSRSRESDDNLHFVRDRLLRSDVDIVSLLELYQKIHRGKPVRDDDTSVLVGVLRLSGIVRTEQDRLAVRNRIYARVFNLEWVAANVPDADLQRQRKAYRRGLLRGAAEIAVIIILLLSIYWLWNSPVRENNRRLLYAAQMNLAQQAWEAGNIERVLELLDDAGRQTDLLGFEWHYFWRLCHSARRNFQAGSEVWTIAFSPDGRVLATGGNNGVVKLWNVAERQELTLARHTGLVRALAFSTDGKLLVTGGDDRTVRLWDTATGAEVAEFGAHDDAVHSIAISPAKNLVISASEEGTIKLWDLNSRELLATLVEKTSPTHSMSLSPNGRTLALGSGMGTVELWDVERRIELGTIPLRQSASRVRALAFSPRGNELAVGSEDGNVAMWDVGKRIEVAAFKSETKTVLTLAFSPDSRTLAVSGEGKIVELWDVASRREVEVWKGHLSLVHAVAFSPDGRLLASGSQDRSVRLWEVNQPQVCVTFDFQSADICALAFSSDNKLLAVAADTDVKLFDPFSREAKTTIPAHQGRVSALVFTADGRSLITASEDESLKHWEIGASHNGQTMMSGIGELYAVALSPDGRLLAVGGQQKIVRLLDSASGKTIADLPPEIEVIRALAFAPDGTKFAAGTAGGIVKVWDTARRQELAALKVHDQPPPVNAVAFSPDGKLLAAAGSDGITGLWAAKSGKLQLLLKGHAEAVLALAFSPDGKRLATGSKDKTIKLWEVEKGLELATFKAHSGDVKTVAFSADGNTLATGGGDGTVKLWRATQ